MYMGCEYTGMILVRVYVQDRKTWEGTDLMQDA